jgi:Tfp pilus assembly protein PilN
MKIKWQWRLERQLPSSSRPAFTPVHIPFESSEIGMVRWIQRSLMLWVMATVGLAGWWVWDSHTLEETAGQYEQAAGRSEAGNRAFKQKMDAEGLSRSAEQLEMLQADVAFANQLAEKRRFSWTRLLSDLEEAVPAQVSITSIKPKFDESIVVLEGVAEHLHDLDRFVQQLQHHRAFRQAVLGKHEMRGDAASSHGGLARAVSHVDERPDPRAVEYSLTVSYRPAL